MYRKLVLLFFATGITLVLLMVAVFYTLDLPIKAEWWIRNREYVLDHIASKIHKPKIITCSGSNSLLGVNGEILEDQTGYGFMTIGTFGGIASFDYYEYLLNKYARKGDVVIMPLEFEYYSAERVSDFEVRQVAAWNKSMFRSLPFTRQAEYLVRLSPLLYMNTGWFNLDERKFLDRQAIVKRIERLWRQEKGDGGKATPVAGYRFEFTDPYGAFLPIGTDRGLERAFAKGWEYLGQPDVSSFFVSNFKRLKRGMELRGVRLYLTWPVSIRNDRFDLTHPLVAAKACALASNLEDHGIKIYGSPAFFQYPISFFWDTQYHLNRRGAVVRSAFLVRLLSEIAKGEEVTCSPDEIANQARMLTGMLARSQTMTEGELVKAVLRWRP